MFPFNIWCRCGRSYAGGVIVGNIVYVKGETFPVAPKPCSYCLKKGIK